jgi:hypothetical protein
MEINPYVAFIFFSSGMAMAVQMMKKLVPALKHSRILVVLPMLIGMLVGPFIVPRIDPGADMGWMIFVGFMAGALSTSCYQIVKLFLKSVLERHLEKEMPSDEGHNE